MNVFLQSSRFARAKLFVIAAAAVFATTLTPGMPAAAASAVASPAQIPVAKIYIGPLTVSDMRSWCGSAYGTIFLKKIGVNWFCNRPFGFDPVVNYTAACKKAYHNPTAFAGPPNAFGSRKCYKPLPWVSPG